MLPRTGSTRSSFGSARCAAGTAALAAIQAASAATTAGALKDIILVRRRLVSNSAEGCGLEVNRQTELENARRQRAGDVLPRGTVAQIGLQHGVGIERVVQRDPRLHPARAEPDHLAHREIQL